MLLMGDVERPIISMIALCMHLLSKHLSRVGSATYLKEHLALGSVMQRAMGNELGDCTCV